MYTETPDIIPFTSPIKGEVLNHAELEKLKRKNAVYIKRDRCAFSYLQSVGYFCQP